MVLIDFEISSQGRSPDPVKVQALHDWPVEAELADVNSMFHFANYLREFIPHFTDIVQPLKPYRAKRAKWEDYKNDPEAIKASKAFRQAVAVHCPLVNPDFKAAYRVVPLTLTSLCWTL